MGLNELLLPNDESSFYIAFYMPQLLLALVQLLQMYKRLPITVDPVKDWALGASEYLKHHMHYYAGGFVLYYFYSWMMTRCATDIRSEAVQDYVHRQALKESTAEDRSSQHHGRSRKGKKEKPAVADEEAELVPTAPTERGVVVSFIISVFKMFTLPLEILAKMMKYFTFLWACHLPLFYFNSTRLLTMFSMPLFNGVWFMGIVLFTYSLPSPFVTYLCLTALGLWHWWTYMKYTKFELYDNVIVDTYHAITDYILPALVDLFWVKFGSYIIIFKWTWPVAKEALHHYFSGVSTPSMPFFSTSTASTSSVIMPPNDKAADPLTTVSKGTDDNGALFDEPTIDPSDSGNLFDAFATDQRPSGPLNVTHSP